jgi:hypothetical protein
VPTPVAGETLAESNAFWEYWTDYPASGVVFEAQSLEENVAIADLVVRGHITDVYVGEYWVGGTPVVYVTLAISEVLTGSPISRTPGFVEVGLGTGPEVTAHDRRRLPQHDSVWFLLYELNLGARPPGLNSDIAPFAYLPTNDLQGVLRNIDGEVKIIKPHWTKTIPDMGPGYFPLSLQGTSFDRLVERVREIARSMPEAAPTASP